MGRIVPVVAVAVAAYLVGIGVILPAPPTPTDPGVAMLDIKFAERIAREDSGLSISSKGWLLRDRDTTFWKMFTDKFGANPNTPYMWSALPLIGFLLPSPMWNLGKQDAVVLLARNRHQWSTSRSRPLRSSCRAARRHPAVLVAGR